MDAAKNFAKATLAAGISNVATSVSVAAGKGALFPASAFNATIHNATDYTDPADDPGVEIVRVTAGFGTDTFTITRAQEGTAAAAHNTAAKSYVLTAGVTAKTLTDLVRTLVGGYEGTPFTARTGITASGIETLTIPAGSLEVGDIVELWGLWKHTGNLASAPRFGVSFGGDDIMTRTATAAIDTYDEVHAHVVVTGTSAQHGIAYIRRFINGAQVGPSAGTLAIDITADIDVGFTYRMDATGETVQLVGARVTIHKAA